MAGADVQSSLQPPPRAAGCTNFKLRQLLRAVARHYDAQMSQAGLKGTQYSLLSHVVAFEPVGPAELAQRMGLDASTLTRNLKVLIELGWVTQGPGGDARSRLVRMTAAGREKHAEAKRCWKRAQRSLREKLGEGQVAALHALIDHGLAQLAAVESDAESEAESAAESGR